MGGDMFLIRAAFWLSVAILFIPAGEQAEHNAEHHLVSTGEAVSAVQAVWSDLSEFCTRNPAVCDTGNAALSTFAQKAKNGARMLHDYLDTEEPDNGRTLPASVPDSAESHEAPGDDQQATTTLYANGIRS